MVIVQHYPHSAKHYAEASPSPGVLFPIPNICPDCGATGVLIRWGFYERWVYMGDERFTILIQRVRCNACGHTHSLLPDFLHPYRRYVVSLLQRVVFLYLFAGLGTERLTEHLPCQKPPRSTAREWITSFAYGAGRLLLNLLRRRLMELNPLTELPETPPPRHLNRVANPTKRRCLANAHRFWQSAEHLYALVKNRAPYLHFEIGQLLPFLLHWLQKQEIIPRIFWSPCLAATPTEPF